jgi:hypothetical protein
VKRLGETYRYGFLTTISGRSKCLFGRNKRLMGLERDFQTSPAKSLGFCYAVTKRVQMG